MISDKNKQLKEKIITIGRQLYDARLVVACSGNLSACLDKENILITATGASLGELEDKDILEVNFASEEDIKNKPLSTEFPLHALIYKNFPIKTVIHCHPPLANGYFAVYSNLKALTFESKLYLGNVPVVPQETPSITKPELVVEALKMSNLVVIKNHGVICVAEDFTDGFNLIETLEEAVKVTSIARLWDKTILDDLDRALKEDLMHSADSISSLNDKGLTKEPDIYPMFSKEHIQAIVDLVNKDELIAAKGKELDLTVKIAIRLDGTDKAYKFNFEKGKIVRLDFDSDAPFIISGPPSVWEQVFLGKLDSFVAVTQGKMKLQGQLGQLSKWYVPFTQLFQIFKQVKFK